MCVAAMLCACNSNEPKEQQRTPEQAEAQMYQRLSALREKYGAPASTGSISNVNGIKRAKQGETDEFTKAERARIAEADAAGLLAGMGAGATTGAAIGTAAGPAGVAAAGAAGAVAGAVGGAALFSALKAEEIRGEHEENAEENALAYNDIYMLDIDNPVNDFTMSDPFFDWSIRGANMGWAHNFLISAMYNEYKDEFFEMSTEQKVVHMFEEYIYPNNDAEYYCWKDAYIYTLDNCEYEYNRWKENPSDFATDEVILLFNEELKCVSDEYWFDYAQDYMRIVDQELGGWADDRVLIINGYISTFFYSYCLWNLNVPRQYSGKYLFFDLLKGTWESVMCEREYLDMIAMADPGRKLVFIPRIREGQIVNLFLMDYHNESQLDCIKESEYIVGEGADLSFTVPFEQQSLEFWNSNEELKDVFIPAGTYQLQRFAEGYFVALR